MHYFVPPFNYLKHHKLTSKGYNNILLPVYILKCILHCFLHIILEIYFEI